jgi:hypothetical protein
MPIPSVSHFRVPLLQILGDGKERTLAESCMMNVKKLIKAPFRFA